MKLIHLLAGCLVLTIPLQAQDEVLVTNDDPAAAKLVELEKSAVSFVEAYNAGDSDKLASLFLPEGELVLATGELVGGREGIKSYYDEVFARPVKAQAALEAGSVRFVTPGIAVEDGTMHFTVPSGEVVSHHYTAVQVEQPGGKWLTASVRDELEDSASATDKLLGLEWIVGDWIAQSDEGETFMTFEWSKQGPFIMGRLLTEISAEDHVSSTFRIGWDGLRKDFVSWSFDALGGFNHSEWQAAGAGTWLIRTKGVTADGEPNQATQVLSLDSTRQFFTWDTRDQIIGGEVQPDRTLKIVKRPPPVSISEKSAE